MAENAAHLTSAVFSSKPSIFEVIAQDNLTSTIRPAFKHAIKVLAESRPEKFGWAIQWFDEIYTVLDLILQNYYLNFYNGSFAENFYGLRRLPISKELTKLTRSCKIRSLMCLVLFPYVKHKLDHWFEELRHNLNTGRLSQSSPVGKIYRAFVTIYPYVHMTWEGSLLYYLASYMFGKSDCHSPLVKWSRVQLVHQLEEDLEQLSDQSCDQFTKLSLSHKIFHVMRKSTHYTAVALSTGLSVGVFFLQFLDWWYASENNAPSLMALPIPDPPKAIVNEMLPPPDVCPICLKKRTNDTALSISGYVFCYPCIYEYVQQYGSCPVTSYPARKEHLIKLYPPDSK